MSRQAASARARLQRWHAEGAGQVDPVRFHLMQALAARAKAQADAAVRAVLEDRLAALVDQYAAVIEQAAARATPRAVPPAPQRSRLAALSDQLASHAALMEVDSRKTAAADALPFPELPALDDFRRTWTTVRTASQVRQSLQDAPKDAGPLNSSVLVHRCISLMRERSPGYLQHFLGYVDALSWLEQMHTGGVLADETAAPIGTAARKRSRSSTAKRRS
ncbi:DUF2894 domain-containing protein [Xanthomonas campestris pv. badrii]|uniref:DUF2894 domain-containing protein n=1 Tax=Xanthomonas campestris pv. badrii TaxID=149696 RepID=A0A7Z2VCU4_XANCA|nr:DUF2894 domain-containing protein [Xanthomonas campestris]QJD69022.1 DUF2894 domain-containing protein [Xanthomonas campestris pv. badrii]